jgi:hypothetical protein
MKIKEVTNPEEQLGLLRVIIDNTWSAIKQQADTEARQKVAQPGPKSKAKSPKAPKPAPYAAMPKPLPKPKALYPAKPTSNMKSAIGKAVYKQPQADIDTPKPFANNHLSQTTTSLSNLEKDEMLNLPRRLLPKPL